MRNPVESQTRRNYRFVAGHPDGSTKHGAWTSKVDASNAAHEYAKRWLSGVKDLGLEGQKVTISIQTRTEETRVFVSQPAFDAEYSQVETDRWGNVRGIR